MLLSLLSRRSLEVDSRDSYGFALRPQHTHRYREYANIYKEEEEERSDKWTNFLDQVVQSSQQCPNEKEVQDKLKSEVREQQADDDSEKCEEPGGDDLSGKKFVSDELTESDLEKSIWDYASEKKPVSYESTENDPENKVDDYLSKKKLVYGESTKSDNEKSIDSSEKKFVSDESAENDPEKHIDDYSSEKKSVSDESTKSDQETSIDSSEKKFVSDESAENVPEKHIDDYSSEKKSVSDESTKSDQETSIDSSEKKFVSDESAENDSEKHIYYYASEKKFVSDNSAKSDPEKKFQFSKETKAYKFETWTHIRPSLGVLENMMASRVKKRKIIKDELKACGDHLPSLDEGRSMLPASDEDFKVQDPTNGLSFYNVDASGAESDARDVALKNRNVSSMENVTYEGDSQELFFPWKEELRSLVRGGLPKDLRGEIWQAFVGVKARRVEGYYQDLLAQDTQSENVDNNNLSGVPKKWKKQIEKDIPRTFPGHPALNENGRNSLRRILLAYALHNPSVGYCQAMNFFAGLLLLLMPEENAFWTLVGIIDDYFDGYYTEEMVESQVDQLVLEELMRERFPKLVNHLDYLGVQVAWITGPWFLSIFVNMLPWESVLRVWDVLLFEGNRVMLFRTAFALMELYGPALVTTKDAGDAITLLQSLSGSTFDSSQLVLTACMGFMAISESRLQELRKNHRPSIIAVVEERTKRGRIWKDSKGLASKLYSFKHDPGPLVESKKLSEEDKESANENENYLARHSSNLDDLLNSLAVDSELDSLPDLQEQVVWLKVELCRLLEEKRSAVLRSEELETALMEMVKQDNRRQLSARIEQLELEVSELQQILSHKKEQETAMLQILMRVEQELKVTEDARISAEQEVAAQKYAVHVLQEKYEMAMASIVEMEKRVVMAESMLEATLNYESGQVKKTPSSPRLMQNIGSAQVGSSRKIGLLPFGLGWRDRNKGKPASGEEAVGNRTISDHTEPNSLNQ